MSDKSKDNIISLLNIIWRSYRISNTWKHSIICPILKQGKNTNLSLSYIPIALTSHLCKIMEIIIDNRFMWILVNGLILITAVSGKAELQQIN